MNQLLNTAAQYLLMGFYLAPCAQLENISSQELESQNKPNLQTWRVTAITKVYNVLMVELTNQCPYTFEDTCTTMVELELLDGAMDLDNPIQFPDAFNSQKQVEDAAPFDEQQAYAFTY